MKRLLCAGLLALSLPAHANDWTGTDTALEVAWQLAHAVDWGQTRYIAKHPQDFRELNPFLGEHPSVGRVNTYFALTGLAHYAISRYIPAPKRRVWQSVTIGFAVGTVAHNHSIGVKIDF